MSKQGVMTDNDAPVAGAPRIVFTMPSLRADSDSDGDPVEESAAADEAVELDERIESAVEDESSVDEELVVDDQLSVDEGLSGDDEPVVEDSEDVVSSVDIDDVLTTDTEKVAEPEPAALAPTVLPGGGFAPPTPDTRAEYMYALVELERERIIAATVPKPGIVKRLRDRKK